MSNQRCDGITDGAPTDVSTQSGTPTSGSKYNNAEAAWWHTAAYRTGLTATIAGILLCIIAATTSPTAIIGDGVIVATIVGVLWMLCKEAEVEHSHPDLCESDSSSDSDDDDDATLL